MDKVKSGFFAATHVTDSTGHVAYNAWHSTDHIPENLALDGIVLGTRWVAPRRYMAERHVSDKELEEHQYLVHYLMTEPLPTVFREFADLGARTRDLGRFFAGRDIIYAGHHRLLKSYTSPGVPISEAALPFRPHAGVVVMITDLHDRQDEQAQSVHWDQAVIPAAVKVPGVLGASWFTCTNLIARTGEGDLPGRRDITVFYVGGDPLVAFHEVLQTTRELLPVGSFDDDANTFNVAFAGPYATIADPEHYDWWNDESPASGDGSAKADDK